MKLLRSCGFLLDEFPLYPVCTRSTVVRSLCFVRVKRAAFAQNPRSSPIFRLLPLAKTVIIIVVGSGS